MTGSRKKQVGLVLAEIIRESPPAAEQLQLPESLPAEESKPRRLQRDTAYSRWNFSMQRAGRFDNDKIDLVASVHKLLEQSQRSSLRPAAGHGVYKDSYMHIVCSRLSFIDTITDK